jgi:hypothetical protein
MNVICFPISLKTRKNRAGCQLGLLLDFSLEIPIF